MGEQGEHPLSQHYKFVLAFIHMNALSWPLSGFRIDIQSHIKQTETWIGIIDEWSQSSNPFCIIPNKYLLLFSFFCTGVWEEIKSHAAQLADTGRSHHSPIVE